MITDATPVTMDSFNGAWAPSPSQLDAVKIPLGNGRLAKNLQYFGSNCATRYGFSSVFSPANIISALINWLFLNGTTPANYLAWFAVGVGLKIADLASPSGALAIAETTATTASICTLGSRLYVGFMDANGIGKVPGQVYGFGVGADPLFAPPVATNPTFSELGGPGLTTVGAKNFGYLIQTRNGYITRPSPAPSSNFTPTSYTSLGGAILMSIDPAGHVWPDYALNVAPIMTTTANPNQFFIVPSPFPGSSPWWPVTRTGPTFVLIQVTDDALETNGTDATQYLEQLGQTVSGTAPINPSVIAPYGQRLVYICLDSAGVPVAYISNPSLYQQISAATSGVYLPGQLGITTGFALQKTFYLLGPHWTYSTSDNNGAPATWAQPQLVDGRIGAIGPSCVSLNASQTRAWVADEAGLYLFQGGSYPARPVSYWQTADWQRINFAATTKIQVVDYTAAQTVMVMAPLDGATSPTHIMKWDYSLGTEPEQVQYSLDSIASYDLGAIAMVQNNATKHVEPWLAPANATQDLFRANNGTEANPYRDRDQPINSAWETAPVPRGMQGQLIMHHGAQMRIRGSGGSGITDRVKLTVYSVDQAQSAGPFNLLLTANPNCEILQRFYMNNEYASDRIESTALDGWFNLSRIDHYYTPGAPTR